MTWQRMIFATGLLWSAAAIAAEPAPAAWGKLLDAQGKVVGTMAKPEIVIGSDPTADIVVADATVSPRHCKLTYKDGYADVEDLGSKHGTLAAGTALKKGKKFPLKFRTDLTLGAVSLVFDYGDRGPLIPPSQAPKKPPKGWGKPGYGEKNHKPAPGPDKRPPPPPRAP